MPIGYQMQTGMQPTGSPTTPYRCRPMTDPTPNRPPLWQVMQAAFTEMPNNGPIDAGTGFVRACCAAELRAIAERIEDEYASDISVVGVVSMLHAEADRAEAGEQ
jgi:hypothetical protein